MRKLQTRTIVLAALQAFNGLSGLLGGVMLMKDPTGGELGMELAWLQGTPFPDFLIPGIVLFLLVGSANIVGLGFTVKKRKGYARFGLVFGVILMIWILSQVAWIGYKSLLQPLYFATGLLQGMVGYAINESI